MDLKELEEQEKRKAEKVTIVYPYMRPSSPTIINNPDPPKRAKPYLSPMEYRAQRVRENSFLRSMKCPECQADVTLDADPHKNSVDYYTCTKERTHIYIRVGSLPSVMEDMAP